ncbi:protein kinase domain protein [Ichthyophthirius multifiliis]|uniref:Protein kinase domain protein n=1 Tax=Ichthyophthirius multifiliis TaxID=5932 RepID=G0QWB8_ICHMU|nr:protein kinase domain protein [Ichthyophthirius multifiliis]EGR30490.1 protein kinase domain protein [Ichthyophthirius multifiliis]|eukprot:XP_004032077.1 protein kinase domain protein [Ichthyophthirius multifiliis]
MNIQNRFQNNIKLDRLYDLQQTQNENKLKEQNEQKEDREQQEQKNQKEEKNLKTLFRIKQNQQKKIFLKNQNTYTFDKIEKELDFLNAYQILNQIGQYIFFCYKIKQNKIKQNKKKKGKGSYAKVKLAKELKTGNQVAIKIYDKFHLCNPMKKKNVEREINILQQIQHPNIIQMLQTFETRQQVNNIYIYILYIYIYIYTYIYLFIYYLDLCSIFKQILQAVSYLHSKNILHRDIKLENILINNQNNVKVIDFGFSIITNQKLKIFCGTPSYMAPEIIAKKGYMGQPADIWACGVVFYVMLTGEFPFKSQTENGLFNKIINGIYKIPDFISYKSVQILQKIFVVNYKERITAEQCLDLF